MRPAELGRDSPAGAFFAFTDFSVDGIFGWPIFLRKIRTRACERDAVFFNRAKTILTGTGLAHLVKSEWDPFALVDSVSLAGSSSAEYELLQQVQKIEFEVLLKRFCN